MQVRISGDQYEQIQQELLGVESQKLQIEQELLDLVEQRKQQKAENKSLLDNIGFQAQLLKQDKTKARQLQLDLDAALAQNEVHESNIAAMQQQLEFLQNALNENQSKNEELERHNNFLMNRDISIQTTVQKLKAKYKQKIIEKEQEIDQMQMNYSELKQKLNLIQSNSEDNALTQFNSKDHLQEENLIVQSFGNQQILDEAVSPMN